MLAAVESPPSVLVVDDDQLVLEVLRDSLAPHFEVATASSGLQALELLKGRDFDVLLADQRMPKMTGVELAGHARGLRPHLVTVLLSAYTDPADMLAAINHGQVFRFIAKPWEHNDLWLTLQHAAERSRLARDNARLLSELDRRLRALEILQAVLVSSVSGAVQHPAGVLLDRLLEVLPYDLAAVLVVPPPEDGSATLQIRGARPVPPSAVLELRDQLLALYRYASKKTLDEERLRPLMTAEVHHGALPLVVESQLQVPLEERGEVVGALIVQSHVAGALGEDATRLVHALANHTAATLQEVRRGSTRASRHLEQALAALPDGVVVAQADGVIQLANPAARRLLDAGPGQNLWRTLSLDGEVSSLQGRDVQLGNRHLRITLAPLGGESGEPAGVVVTLRDVSHEREVDAKRRRYVSTVSHEIRTPLSSIVATLDLLLHGYAGELSEKQRQYLSAATRASDALNRIVDELLDVEKYAAGGVSMRKRPFNLAALGRDAVNRYRAAAEESGLLLTVAVRGDDPIVTADPVRLEQVVGNLLSNAIKFASQGGVQVEIGAAPSLGDWAVLGVHNGGEPVPPLELPTLFDRFQMAMPDSHRRHKGSGLGLAICRSIVEAHGGNIFAESGKAGTTFWVGLPVNGAPGAEPHVSFAGPLWIDLDADGVRRVAFASALASVGLHVRLLPRNVPEANEAQQALGQGVVLGIAGQGACRELGPRLEVAAGPRLAGDLEVVRASLLACAQLKARAAVVAVDDPALATVLRALGVATTGAAPAEAASARVPAEVLASYADTVSGSLGGEAAVRAVLRAARRARCEAVGAAVLVNLVPFAGSYGAARASLLRDGLGRELNRCLEARGAKLSSLVTERGAVLAGGKDEVRAVMAELADGFSALVRLHCRKEDRDQGYFKVGQERVPLVSLAVEVISVDDEAALWAALERST